MPISAVDAITPAFQHARQQLTAAVPRQPVGQTGAGRTAGRRNEFGWRRLQSRQLSRCPHPESFPAFLDIGLPGDDPMLYASLIAVLMVTGLVLLVLFLYVNSVMRFVLFDSVVAKECRIRQSWSRRQGPGRRYFVWQILLFLAWIVGLTILIGIPAGFAFVVGWLRESQGTHDPADSGRHGPVFCGAAFSWWCNCWSTS